MGQKVHPYCLRVGINKNWKSRWYVNPKEYVRTLHEDLKIRCAILDLPEAKAADVSDIEITRHPQRVSVVIYTSHPGVFIGTKGANIERIGNEIHKKFNIQVVLKVKEIKKAEGDAQCVALSIAKQLKGRSSFRRVLKTSVSSAIKSGVQGIKIKISGRLAGAEMARSVELKEGRVPLQTFRADIDYGFAEVNTVSGIIGVKVWVCKGEVLRKDRQGEFLPSSSREGRNRLGEASSKDVIFKPRSVERHVKISKEVKKEVEDGQKVSVKRVSGRKSVVRDSSIEPVSVKVVGEGVVEEVHNAES